MTQNTRRKASPIREYVQAKVDTAVSAAVDAKELADRDKADREALGIILGFAWKANLPFEDMLACADLPDDVKERVHNLYLAQIQ